MSDHNNLYNILNKLNGVTSQPAKPVTESKQKNLLESTMEEVLSEKYMGFKKTEKAIAKNPDVENPGAVAASIGREKYGKKAFQKAAAAGKKLGEAGDETAMRRPMAQQSAEKTAATTSPSIPSSITKAVDSGKRPVDASGKPVADVKEVAPPGDKAERMVKHIKKGYAKDGNLTDKEKAIAYATTWAAHNRGEVEEGIDHSSVAANLAKLARVIKSVQTPEQFAVAQKYARRMSGAIMKHQHDNSGFGSGLKANIGVMRDIKADLAAKAAELGIEFQDVYEGFPTVADARKKAEKERGTGKFDKKKSDKGTIYTRKYDAKSGESEDDSKDGEGKEKAKRGRGRPKKSAFESHRVINRMVDDVFEDIMGEGDEEQLSYEQEQLKSHIGAHMYKQLENTLKTGDDFSDNLFDVLYDYYMDEMPYGVAKARTGDPTQWLHDKVQAIFPALDEGSIQGGVWRAGPGNVPVPQNPEVAPATPLPASTGKATIAPADANKFMQSSDPQIFNKLTGTSPVGKPVKAISDPEGVREDALASMMKLAGMQINEGKKADKDYDGDGEVESGKDEYLGSKIKAAKKAGKLEEGKMCEKCDCDPCECEKDKVDECMSPMGNGMVDEQEGNMNISTNMDSKGHKSVTITADGNSALELMQMLKLAGMNGGEMPQEEPVVAISTDEPEEVGTGDAGEPEGIMVVSTDGEGEEEEVDEDSRYEANTTPEEHAYNTQALTKGGDGEFGEKKMHPNKPTWKNGDNPMSESISLKMMKEYEGIKIKK